MNRCQNKNFINVYIREKKAVLTKWLRECFTVGAISERTLFIFCLFHSTRTGFISLGTHLHRSRLTFLLYAFFKNQKRSHQEGKIIKIWWFLCSVAAFIKCAYTRGISTYTGLLTFAMIQRDELRLVKKKLLVLIFIWQQKFLWGHRNAK